MNYAMQFISKEVRKQRESWHGISTEKVVERTRE